MFAPGRTGTTLVLLAAGWKDRRSAPMADPIADATGASDQTPGAVTALLLEL